MRRVHSKIEKPDKTKKPPKTAALLREKEEKEKKLLSLATIEDVYKRQVLPLYDTIKPELREHMTYLANFTVPVGWRNQYCGVFTAAVSYTHLDVYKRQTTSPTPFCGNAASKASRSASNC